MSKECCRDDCDKPVHSKGECQAHYRQTRRRERGLKKPGPKPSATAYRNRPDRARHATPLADTCKRGHPFDEENTYHYRGTRICRTCRRDYMLVRRAGGPGRGSNNSAKTHCAKGHPFDEENTGYRQTATGQRRVCRLCQADNAIVQNNKRYGMTPERLANMLQAQGWACAVCLESFDTAGSPNIDHDHACCDGNFSCGDCVRGLLCGDCNRGLGKFKDSVASLLRAAEYLRAFATS